jgi:hypothetical protein
MHFETNYNKRTNPFSSPLPYLKGSYCPYKKESTGCSFVYKSLWSRFRHPFDPKNYDFLRKFFDSSGYKRPKVLIMTEECIKKGKESREK